MMREVEAMRFFKGSKRVIGFNEIHETQNSVYIVMPFCTGGILETDYQYQATPYTRRQLKSIMKASLLCLQELHSKGYMHRDVKPDNLMFAEEYDCDNLMLIDLGMIHYCKEQTGPTFMKCGTPGYMAPEVINY